MEKKYATYYGQVSIILTEGVIHLEEHFVGYPVIRLEEIITLLLSKERSNNLKQNLCAVDDGLIRTSQSDGSIAVYLPDGVTLVGVEHPGEPQSSDGPMCEQPPEREDAYVAQSCDPNTQSCAPSADATQNSAKRLAQEAPSKPAVQAVAKKSEPWVPPRSPQFASDHTVRTPELKIALSPIVPPIQFEAASKPSDSVLSGPTPSLILHNDVPETKSDQQVVASSHVMEDSNNVETDPVKIVKDSTKSESQLIPGTAFYNLVKAIERQEIDQESLYPLVADYIREQFGIARQGRPSTTEAGSLNTPELVAIGSKSEAIGHRRPSTVKSREHERHEAPVAETKPKASTEKLTERVANPSDLQVVFLGSPLSTSQRSDGGPLFLAVAPDSDIEQDVPEVNGERDNSDHHGNSEDEGRRGNQQDANQKG